MIKREAIESLYNRYLNNEISKEELQEFLQILQTPEGERTISSLMDGAWKEMFETQQADVIPLYRRVWYRAMVASILILFTVWSYFVLNNPVSKQIAENQYENDISPGDDRAVLTLANGAQIVLESVANGAVTQQGNTKVIKLDNGQLAYSSLNRTSSEVLYNTISTPKGGQYQIVLADGSKVWLNAASSLRFPASFSGKERKVELSGEGYFEVAENPSVPFIVSVNGMQVEVLGTHFNVNAYHDESSIVTTLLEGSVSVKKQVSTKPESNMVILKPGEQADLAKDGVLKINHAVNLTEVVAWKDGNFEFDNTPVTEIMRQVSRWYDVEIVYEGLLPTHQLTGQISRKVNLSQLIDMIQYTGIQIEIANKKIIIGGS